MRTTHKNVCPPTLKQLEQDIDAQDIITLNLLRAVQLTVDISSHLLISNQAPAPQTMGDSFLGMEKLGVLDSDLALRLRKAVGFRNIAVHNYQNIHWAVVFSIVTERLGDFKAYASAVQAWIDKASS